mgnify:CR=1 FL=1
MSLQVRCINHQRIGRAIARRQVTENLVEYAQLGPTSEAVIERLVRPIGLRRIFPLQTVLQNLDDPRNNATVIHPRHTVRLWKERLDLRHLSR